MNEGNYFLKQLLGCVIWQVKQLAIDRLEVIEGELVS